MQHMTPTPTPAQVQELLTPRQAAERLAISERTLRDLKRRGEIAHVTIGAAVRYAPADLAAFIEKHRRGPTQAE